MGIAFRCPSCGKAFSLRDELAGKKAKCMLCGGMMVVPVKAPEKRPPPPPPPIDLYGFDEEPTALPPRVEILQPVETASPGPIGGPAKKKRWRSGGKKGKGAAGISGTVF